MKERTKRVKWQWMALAAVMLLVVVLIAVSCGGADEPAVETGTPVVEQSGAVAGESEVDKGESVAAQGPAATEEAADPRSKGQQDAPLTIVEYSDYQCPFCSRWVETTYPMVLEEYIDTGKARLQFRDFPLSIHPNADEAAVAARCAGEQGAYWEMHDQLFAAQDEWAQAAGPNDVFASYAEGLGLDRVTFTECLASGKFDDAIRADMRDGQAAGVSGTPSFVINGQLLVGAQPPDRFRDALETVLKGGDISAPQPQAQQPQEAPQPLDIPIADAPVKGDADAPLTIVEYSDYQCPFCGRFFRDTLPALLDEYVATGKVRLVFKDFPLNSIHPQAQKAAEAARCVRELAGSDDAYWSMHNLLFEGQSAWSGQSNADDTFTGYAVELGVDEAAFRECLDSGRYADAVTADLREGVNFGVRGTPTFFINGQSFVGAQPLANFQRAIAIVEQGGNIQPPPQPTPAPTPTPAPLTQEVPLEDAAAIKGNPDAPVTIVEYSDYQCPFCARHFQQTLPQLQQYIDDGTVKYVFKDFPLTSIHPQAPKAAEAARCAGEQDAYWQMHDRLFQNQRQWSGNADAVSVFKSYAEQLELDQAAFNACLDSGKYQDVVQANLREGAGFGVRGTPGFFINRTPLPGAYPFEAFRQLIEAELSQK